MPGARLSRHLRRRCYRGLTVARTSGLTAFPMAAVALWPTFPNGTPHPRPPFGELTGPQQRACAPWPTSDPAPGTWANFMLMMQAWKPAKHTRRIPGLLRARPAVMVARDGLQISPLRTRAQLDAGHA